MKFLLVVVAPWLLAGLIVGIAIGKRLKSQRKHSAELSRLGFHQVQQ